MNQEDKQRLQFFVQQSINGQEGAFDQVCELKGRDILYVCRRLMGNNQDAQDAAQDIFVTMYHHIGKLREAEAFNTWLYRIIRGVCVDMMNKNEKVTNALNRSIQTMEADAELAKDFIPEGFLRDRKNRELIIGAVDQLSVKCKMCMLMYYFEGMRYEDIARSMGIPKKAVSNALSRARTYISDELEQSTRQQEFLAVFTGVTALPAAAELFEADAIASVPGAELHTVLSNVREALAAVPQCPPNLEKTFQNVNTASNAGKVIAGITAVSTVLAGAVLWNYIQSTAPEHSPSSALEEQQVTQIPAYSEAIEEDYDIHTLEDLIGTEEAETLRELAGQKILSKAELTEFLESIGCIAGEGVWNMVQQEEYTLYSYDKKGKQLVVIMRYQIVQEQAEVSFKFMNLEEGVPIDCNIPKLFDDWRGTAL